MMAASKARRLGTIADGMLEAHVRRHVAAIGETAPAGLLAACRAAVARLSPAERVQFIVLDTEYQALRAEGKTLADAPAAMRDEVCRLLAKAVGDTKGEREK